MIFKITLTMIYAQRWGLTTLLINIYIYYIRRSCFADPEVRLHLGYQAGPKIGPWGNTFPRTSMRQFCVGKLGYEPAHTMATIWQPRHSTCGHGQCVPLLQISISEFEIIYIYDDASRA